MPTPSSRSLVPRLALIGIGAVLVLGLLGEQRLLKKTTMTVCEEAGYIQLSEAAISNNHAALTPLDFQPKRQQQQQSWDAMELKRPLNFLHIPKTGGSSILSLSAQNGYNWADCLFPSSWRDRECPPDTIAVNIPPHPHDAPWWHTPIQYLPAPNPYADQDVFAVVRNPYERAVSEYYYYCRFHKDYCFGDDRNSTGTNAKNDTPDRLNAKLQAILWQVARAKKNTPDYYAYWGHWIPQYDYFYDTTKNNVVDEQQQQQPQKRLVAHLLHTERLHDEFAALMTAYNYNLTLPVERNRSRKDLGAKHGAADLTAKTMKLIEVVFEKDFALGGYEMLSGRRGAQFSGQEL